MKHKKENDAPANGKDAGTPPEDLPVAVEPAAEVFAVPGDEQVPEQEAQSVAPAAKPEVDERYLRLQADFENMRKRFARDRADIYSRANENLMSELIPVLDHLELAIKQAGEHGESGPVVDGFKLVADQFVAVLKKGGLEVIDAAGAPFDPHRHESISMVHSDEAAEGVVTEQIRKGYVLGGKVLRPAQVIVSAGPDGGDAAGPRGD